MKIFPAIDIRKGKCVRLFQGKAEKETVYNDNPVLVAKNWEEIGAKALHIVDLDGAFTGDPQNRRIIKEIIKGVNIPVQIGGGIRSLERAEEYIEMGAKSIIIGTSALENANFVEKLVDSYGERVIVSVDAKDGYVCVEGWVNKSNIQALDFTKEIESIGIETIVYTDISKDGTMIGPNYYELKKLGENIKMKIIASGGIGKKEDIEELRRINIYGAIVGKALYEGKIKFEEI